MTFLKSTEKINLTGSYGCEVSSEAPSFRMTYAEANMSVAVLPTKPPVLDGFRPYYKIGEVLEAACTSALSYPRAVLTFILNGKEVSQASLMSKENASRHKSAVLRKTRITCLYLC